MEVATTAVPAEDNSSEVQTHDSTNGVEPAERLEGEEKGEQEPEILKLAIPGEGQLTLTVGGRKPETCTVKLVGGKMDVADGDFDKGSTINLLLQCVVKSIEFVDAYDQYGNISGTERRHKVFPLRVERVRD